MSSHRAAAVALAMVLAGPVVQTGADSGTAAHDLEVNGPAAAFSLDAADSIELPLEIGNRGSETWSGDRGFAVAYHWFDDDGRVVVWDGARTPLTVPVPAGESRIVDATLVAPRRSGTYRLQWDVVQEGELWVSQVDPTPVAAWSVTVRPTHAFTVLGARTPRVLTAGGRRPAVLELRNDGPRAWPGDGSVALAYHWMTTDGRVVDWEGRRSPVAGRVEPGDTIELETWVEAPVTAGRLALQWDMVEEGVCWFSERDATPEPLLPVVVAPAVVVHPGLWSLLVLAAAGWLVLVRRRPGTDGRPELFLIAWFALSIVVKQAWVLRESVAGLAVSGLAFSAASAVLIGTVLALLPRRLRPWVYWLAGAMATAVLYADLIHLRFFGDLGSMAALRSVGQVGRVGASVLSLIRADDVWFWSDLLAAGVMASVVARSSRPTWSRARILAGGVALAGLLGGLGLASFDRASSVRQVFQSTLLARQIGVVNLHLVDVGATLMRDAARPRLSDADVAEIVGFFEDRRTQRAGTGPHFGAMRGRNLVMIQVESLQAFVVGLRIGGREVTPTLNSLTERSFTFTNVTDQTREGRSSDSELATQVSLLPPDRGAAAFLYADNHYTGLAAVLAERGYATLSAVPFDGAFWNRRVTHPAYGYRQSLFVGDFEPGETVGWGLSDRDFLAQAARRLSDVSRPWCAYLLTLSLHHPFEGFPDSLKELDVGDWEDTPVGNYLHTMHHFDQALAGFLADLERLDLADHTVIVLWGDHDAGFEWREEHAAVMGETPDAAGWYLSQRVPLVIHAPGLAAPTEASTVPAGHVDVAPTVLGLLGVDAAAYPFIGRNLLGEPGPGPVVGEYRCWRDETHLYLRGGPELEDGRCIDLSTMTEVGGRACAASFDEASRRVEISRLVLEYDLQQRLCQSLADHP
ncbi:MAG: LTA synthase family protein [Candidatus Sulfomarinibacteraceae bacterium]